jgi:hypothetical protein
MWGGLPPDKQIRELKGEAGLEWRTGYRRNLKEPSGEPGIRRGAMKGPEGQAWEGQAGICGGVPWVLGGKKSRALSET